MGSPMQLLDQYRGQKNVVQSSNFKLGETGWVLDRTRSGQNEYSNSGQLVEVMIVKADATISTPAGLGVKFTTASMGMIVTALSGSGEIADGIVDPDLSGSLASGDTFLLFRKGPMDVTLSGAVGANARLKTNTGGKFVTATEMSPTNRGRLMVASSTDGDIRRAMMDFTIP